MIIFFSALLTTLAFLTQGPTFSLYQVHIKENVFFLIILHLLFAIIFLLPKFKRALLSALHIVMATSLAVPLLPYLLPQQEVKTHEDNAVPIETLRITYGEECTYKEPQFHPITTMHGTAASLRTIIAVDSPSRSWETLNDLISPLGLSSKRFKNSTSGITLDVVNLPSPHTEDYEYRGRVGLRRLAGELRNLPRRRVVIGGFGSSIYSERIKLLRTGSRLHEIGWHQGLFINPMSISPFNEVKVGYDGIWLSRDIASEVKSINRCANNDSVTIELDIYERSTPMPELAIGEFLSSKD
jgi:hypothetical protein